jgi:hypothetical protein
LSVVAKNTSASMPQRTRPTAKARRTLALIDWLWNGATGGGTQWFMVVSFFVNVSMIGRVFVEIHRLHMKNVR